MPSRGCTEGRGTIQERPCIEIVPGAGESITIPAQPAAFLKIDCPVAKRGVCTDKISMHIWQVLAHHLPNGLLSPLLLGSRSRMASCSRGTIVYDDTKVQSAA
jgi:hypothetical protein